MKICYFIGQFPSPSHTYFWREINALQKHCGLTVEIASTQHPTTALANHSWVNEAIAKTVYLYPFEPADITNILKRLAFAFPFGWLRCANSVLRADVTTLKERVRLIQFIIIGAKLVSLSKQRGWNHIHVGFCRDAANIALFAKLLGGPEYSLTLHGDLKSFGQNQHQKWSHASFGTAVSNYLHSQLISEIGAKLPPTSVASMGIDPNVMVRSKPYTPWRGDGALKIVCIARLTPEKGQHDLLKAVAMLIGHGIPAELTLAGEDMDEHKWFTHKLLAEAKQLGIENQLNLIGAVADETVIQLLEDSHIFVLASYSEGLGVAAMEAMAMGLPVIVSNVGGLPELVSNGKNGLIVPLGDSMALYEKLVQLASNPTLAAELGQNAREETLNQRSCKIGARVLADKILALHENT